MDFLRDIGTSLLASALFLALVWAFSKTARRLLRGLAAHLLHLDVEEVFVNSRDAAHDIKRELGRAREVSILTGRGAELQRDLFEELLLRCRARRCRCRILLPKLAVPAGEPDWITDREEEIQVFDSAFGTGLLRRQIAATYDYLAPLTVAGHLEARGYGAPHIGRIIATERVVYLTPYSADRHGRESPVIKYRRGETFDVLMRLIDKLWVGSGSA
ncbi:hypothetical protein OIE62_29665 [Streptomyces scopuliridis]|uniref:Uncharacterized protein n=1 Tax=Streptomyces scopuliridis TaxID=452529 RepID=A0ACD4ZI97_9ACTN|nr:hypothetical protein [Streptomyces scopuliridis]WSB97536.1 hypothetical protein OG835_11270 [Streptomyces scopuliridis]WSC08761.1 hypothetical protein OIE62_29665 [Streptomyces scopuliridis]